MTLPDPPGFIAARTLQLQPGDASAVTLAQTRFTQLTVSRLTGEEHAAGLCTDGETTWWQPRQLDSGSDVKLLRCAEEPQ